MPTMSPVQRALIPPGDGVKDSPVIIDTSLAEEWLSPDVFKYKGKLYRLNPDLTVSEVGE